MYNNDPIWTEIVKNVQESRMSMNWEAELAKTVYRFNYPDVQITPSTALSKRIHKALETLTPRESQVLRLRFEKGMTLREAGLASNGVTPERVRQIQEKALRKLRHPWREALLAGDEIKY